MTFTKENVLSILNENSNKKVSSIITLIDELQVVVKTKKMKTFLLDSENRPFAIFCYYHKQWELLSETEYGVKTKSTTGLNTMCKVGVNLWTKQQTIAKKQESVLLEKIMKQEVTIEDAQETKNEIEQARISIDLGESIGYTLEEIQDLLN